MTSIFGKLLKYVGNWLNYVINGFKNVENDLDTWEMAKIFGKWLRCMGHLLSILETALLCWKCLKNLRNGSNM